jgi:outer membrane protein OmpA-like peptidoglycan-associated protein
MKMHPTPSLLAAALTFAVAATGCTTTPVYTGSTQPVDDNQNTVTAEEAAARDKTKRGALIGAGIGAVVGAISGGDAVERRQRALIGAGVGALAGTAIGAYQDKQERELRESLAGTGVDVVRKGDDIVLNMPSAITFGFNSSELNPAFYSVLDRVANVTSQNPQTMLEVAGHTDSIGSDAYNDQLSQRRAQAVANYLSSRGVNSNRLMTVGGGERYPVASNETEEGRAQNRRVEISVMPVRG